VDSERAKFQGSWKLLTFNLDGEQATLSMANRYLFRFEGNNYTDIRSGQTRSQGTFALDPTQSPPSIDLSEATGVKMYGIYRLEGDRLTICLCEEQRPTEFASRAGQRRVLMVLERAME
jgi:uncharacterized protein (TIGR03067 family)